MPISIADIKTLWGRARGRCSICDTPLSENIKSLRGAFPIGEHAHIVSEAPDGPRGTSPLTKEERDLYQNLILVCPTCHAKIDKDMARYSVAVLHALKDAHEARGGSSGAAVQKGERIEPGVGEIVNKVRRVFAAHGLLPMHWSRFLKSTNAPFSISLADIRTDEALLRWLDDESKIQWVADTFLVRREWLDGEDSEIHQRYFFDKDPELFFSTVREFHESVLWEKVHASTEAFFIRRGGRSDWISKGESDVLVVLRFPIARMSPECTIYRYLSDFEDYSWEYGRTHFQLRAWIRLLDLSLEIHCMGRDASLADFQLLRNNETFLPELFKAHHFRPADWHPDDYGRGTAESRVAKETASLPHVLEFLRAHHLPFEEVPLGGIRSRRSGKSGSEASG